MTKKTFKVAGVLFEVGIAYPTTNTPTVIETLFNKEYCPYAGSKDEIELIKAITANQYKNYKIINTSIKDLESLKTNLLLQEQV